MAVSGGPDSLAMLFALNNLRAEMGLELHGAHLDHGLRGDASEADARFVAGAFRNLGIGLTSERTEVGSFQKRHRLSLEEAARKVRYAFLARVARERRADAVALGHTSDDQAETVLMHLVRGSGLTGLRGMEMAARRTIEGKEVVLVRPLLRLTREDTEAYCHALKLKPRLDESNLSVELRRNRVRWELLPMLERYNPAIRKALVRLSSHVARELEYLDRAVDSKWHETVRQDRDCITLDRNMFHRLEPALQSRLLRRAVATVKGDLEMIGQSHIDDMARLMGGPAGRMLHLPQGIRFSVGYNEAIIASKESDLCPLPPLEGEWPLTVPGETSISGWRVTANVLKQSPAETLSQSSRGGMPPFKEDVREGESASPKKAFGYLPGGLRAYVSYDAVGSHLFVRPRRRGDRFQPLGMSRPKKLQDFMVDSKIPRQWRDRVPLVVSTEGIAWVAGWRIADWARVKEEEKQRLELSFLPEER